MMQQHIDRSRQTGGSMTTSVALHAALLFALTLMMGGPAIKDALQEQLTEIAYIEAHYGEDVAAKVKLKEPPRRKPEPPGAGIATDSAMKPAEPASPEPPRPQPKPLTARPDLPLATEMQRPQVAAAEIAAPLVPTAVETKTLAAAPQLEAKAPRPKNRQVIDASRLQGAALAKVSADPTVQARATARPDGQFKPQEGALQSKGGSVALGGDIVADTGTTKPSGAVTDAPAVAAGGSLKSNGQKAYQPSAAALAPAGSGGGTAGGTGVLDVTGPTGAGSGGQGSRKTILDYGSGGGGRGGGSLNGRARMTEPEATSEIVATTAAEPAAKQAVAEVKLDGKGVGMTISGQIQGRKILKSEMPQYTDLARRKGWEGVVAVHFTVLPDGRVKDNMFLEQTSVHRDLNQMALEAIKQFRFAPLPNDQAAVEQWGVITIVFRLN